MKFMMQPWPWHIAGPFLVLVMVQLFYYEKKLGVSSNLETISAIEGIGRFVDYFRFNWTTKILNRVFLLGGIFIVVTVTNIPSEIMYI